MAKLDWVNYMGKGELIEGVMSSEHILYSTFNQMHERCRNTDSPNYPNYGGRGIYVCDRWNTFSNFVNDMGAKPSPEHSLERKDNDGPYSPENCTWDTRSNQCINRRRFKNNTTGVTGVVKNGASWIARMDYEGVRYNIGWFATKVEAEDARSEFEFLFFNDRDAAVASLPKDKARINSQTGERGINPHPDGSGYVVRLTVNKVRHYIGYFTSYNEALHAKQRFIEQQA